MGEVPGFARLIPPNGGTLPHAGVTSGRHRRMSSGTDWSSVPFSPRPWRRCKKRPVDHEPPLSPWNRRGVLLAGVDKSAPRRRRPATSPTICCPLPRGRRPSGDLVGAKLGVRDDLAAGGIEQLVHPHRQRFLSAPWTPISFPWDSAASIISCQVTAGQVQPCGLGDGLAEPQQLRVGPERDATSLPSQGDPSTAHQEDVLVNDRRDVVHRRQKAGVRELGHEGGSRLIRSIERRRPPAAAPTARVGLAGLVRKDWAVSIGTRRDVVSALFRDPPGPRCRGWCTTSARRSAASHRRTRPGCPRRRAGLRHRPALVVAPSPRHRSEACPPRCGACPCLCLASGGTVHRLRSRANG